MRRKYLFAALLCSVCMTAPYVTFASDADTAQETAEAEDSEDTDSEADDSDAAEDADDTAETDDAEEDTEEASDSDSEEASEEDGDSSDSEEEEEQLERPEYQALDYVTLGDYKNITVNRDDLGVEDVTEEDIDENVTSNLKSLAESMDDVIENLTEGKVQEGDIANIDYVGTKDGEEFDGGSAEGYDLEIGSGSFIDGFEDGLIGASIGDTVDLNLTFPEDYQSTDLAGQDVVFTVTINSVERMPELTDDLVNTVTEGEYTDLDSYRESVKSDLEADVESQIQEAAQEAAFTQVQDASEISGYPEGLQEYTEQFIHNYYEYYASMYGMEFEDFLSSVMGMTEEEFDEQVADAAVTNMDMELCMKAILESEDIEITDDDYEELATSYGYESADDMKSQLDSTSLESVYLGLLQEKAYAILSENMTIEDAAAGDEAAEETSESTSSDEDATSEAADETTAEETSEAQETATETTEEE